MKVERIGEEIVNSISIHRIQDEDAHLDDIVAVLTNNDKTVRVYSLPSSLETAVIDLPFPINHATISPDGETMVAVGDFNQAFFFQREIQDTPPQIHKPHNRLTSASIEWTLTSVVNLHLSEAASTTGYFTTAWSPNGQLVAVGSEGGYITVFDVEMLANPDLTDDSAVVAVVPSSRPDFVNPHPGAVRSMMFSPEPWDLLIWAEDQGRICIGDLRTGLKSRQIVNLEPKDESLRHITYEDIHGDAVPQPPPRDIDDLEAEFIQRYSVAPDRVSATNYATEYIEARRRQRQQRQDMAGLRSQQREASALQQLQDDPRGLTPREQQILESLRTTRQREEARAAQGGVSRSVNYTSSDLFRSASTAPTTGDSSSSSSARPISEILSSVPDSFPELSRTNAQASSVRPSSSHGPPGGGGQEQTLPSLSTLQDEIWRSASSSARATTGLVRLSDGSRLPRRRASVILTPPATNTATSSSSAGNASSSAAIPTYRPLHPVATVLPPEEAEENPWRTIEEHMTLARGPLFESASASARASSSTQQRRTEADLQAELSAERSRARSLARQRERWRSVNLRANDGADSRLTASMFAQGGEGLLRRMQMRGGYGGREVGARTAGLAMSADGRTLWAACEEGIFEIRVGVKGRLFWPAVEVR